MRSPEPLINNIDEQRIAADVEEIRTDVDITERAIEQPEDLGMRSSTAAARELL